MKCKHCNGTGTTNWFVNGTFLDCPYCGGTGEMEMEMTNFEKITKNAGTLTTWLSEKLYFCSVISCEECVAKQECYSHESNDTEDYTNADLWYAWLKQPQTTE